MSSESVTCRSCDEAVGEWAVQIVYGEWDSDAEKFQRCDKEWYLCRQCWNRDYDRPKATTYQTDDADELWEVLAASGGHLAVDLSAYRIPGPCFARVVDDELQVATTIAEEVSTGGEYELRAQEVDAPQTMLEETIAGEMDAPIYLVPTDSTPFAELYDDVRERSYF